MYDWVVLWEWVEIAVRWTHVITAVAWIGSSFYFIALTWACTVTATLPAGPMARNGRCMAAGFSMSSKSGGPAAMPDHLVWFKWESYSTWLSGFRHAGLGLLPRGRTLSHRPGGDGVEVWQAIAISLASLAFGWLIYNTLCRVFVMPTRPADVALFIVLVGMSWFSHAGVFGSRGAPAPWCLYRHDHVRQRLHDHHAHQRVWWRT